MSEIQDWRSREILVGNSPAIRRIYDQLQKASLTEVPVLITGESGTGKGLAAKLLHNMSERRAHTFLKLSCATLSSRFFDWDFRNDSTIRKAAEEFEVPEIYPVSCGTLFLD